MNRTDFKFDAHCEGYNHLELSVDELAPCVTSAPFPRCTIQPSTVKKKMLGSHNRDTDQWSHCFVDLSQMGKVGSDATAQEAGLHAQDSKAGRSDGGKTVNSGIEQ